jgi:hypothetical protein
MISHHALKLHFTLNANNARPAEEAPPVFVGCDADEHEFALLRGKRLIDRPTAFASEPADTINRVPTSLSHILRPQAINFIACDR